MTTTARITPPGPAAPPRLTRRAVVGGLLSLPLLPSLAALAACAPGARPSAGAPSQPATAAVQTLQVATVYPYLGYLPVYAAIQRGHLRERGLALELREFKGGGDAGKAFVGGAADLLIGSYDHVLKLREQGLDVVAAANVEATYAYALMAKRGTPFTSLDAVTGTKLGTTGPGSSTDVNLRYGLRQRGIDPDRQVELIAVGGGGPMLAALDHDQIAAGMFLDPLLTQLLGQPDRYQVVHDFRTLEYPLLCVTARRDWLRKHEGTARALLAALVAAEAELQADPSAALAAARERFPDIEPAVLEAAVANTLPRLSADGRISEAAHQNVLDRQLFAGVLTSPLPYREAVDLQYLPA